MFVNGDFAGEQAHSELSFCLFDTDVVVGSYKRLNNNHSLEGNVKRKGVSVGSHRYG